MYFFAVCLFFFLPSSAPSLLFSHPMIRITNTLSGQKEMKKRVGSLKRKHEKVFYIFIITNNALFSAGARFRAVDFCHHPATATGDSEATRNFFFSPPPSDRAHFWMLPMAVIVDDECSCNSRLLFCSVSITCITLLPLQCSPE